MKENTAKAFTLAVLGMAAAIMGCNGGGEEMDAVEEEESAEDVGFEDGVDAGDDGGEDPDAEPDIGEADDVEEEEGEAPPDPLAPFERFCRGEAWDARLTPAVVEELGGEYAGQYMDFTAGTMETMNVIARHPFHVKSIRLAFARTGGVARIRLMKSFGHSYPDLDGPGGDLITPVDLTVDSPDPESWVEIDVSGQDVYLLPTEHYVIVYEHLAAAPYLAVETLVEGDYSRGLILVPGEDVPYGILGNYRMQLSGDYFCSWEGAELWFGEDATQPFAGVVSGRVAVSDLDGDGHDDLILNDGGPKAFIGDGSGGFSEPAFDPFPDAHSATMLVFGDLDNDGDEDAFAATYVGLDGDGDEVTITEGDCNDTDASVNPSAPEVAGNGMDDDCDGVADDGTSVADGDGDTVTIAAGDCNDNRAQDYPGAAEVLDGCDNDCDTLVDEDFVNRVLLNDGTGLFSAVASSGVEALDPSAAAALGDGNGDGILDVYWGNWLVHYPDPLAVQDRYMTGNGDGTFTEATGASGMSVATPRAAYGVLWGDYNNDAFQDIWVGNYGYGLNYLWTNDGGGHFTDMGVAKGVARDGIGVRGGNTFGGDFGDIDNDGDLDLYEANIAHPRYQPDSDPSLFLVNQGPPDYTFVNMREELGLHYDEGDVNAAFADYDNDMDLDIVVCSLYTGHYSRLYRNDGPGGFTDVTYETGTAVHDSVSAAWSDVDEDGDLDLFIADRAGVPCVHLFINRAGQDNGWVELVLEGTAANSDAVGARVTLEAGGVTQIREVKGGGGHSNTQGTRIVHFGLAGETAVDAVTVRWPWGDEETITGLAPNGRFLVVEGSGAGVPIP